MSEHQALVQRSQLDNFVAAVLPPNKREAIAATLPAHVPIERFERNLHNALMAQPKLMTSKPHLVFREVSKIAALGLYVDPHLGEAAIFPGKGGEPQSRIMYKGLIKLARQSGDVVSIYAHDVRALDHCEISLGVDKKLDHRPNMFADRGAVVGFYAVVKFKTGETDFEIMSVADVNAIRARSDGYNSGGRSPWKTDYDEMGKKTVLRRLCKRLPQSPDLAEAWKLDDAEHEGRPPMRDISPDAAAMVEPTRADFEHPIVEASGEPTPVYPIVDPAGEVVAEAFATEWLSDMLAHTSRTGDAKIERAWIDANKATALAIAADDDTPDDDRTAILAMYAPAPEPRP